MPPIANCIVTWRDLYHHPFVATNAACFVFSVAFYSTSALSLIIGYASVFAGLSVYVYWYIAYLLVLLYCKQSAYANL